jgi:hypothetical protein
LALGAVSANPSTAARHADVMADIFYIVLGNLLMNLVIPLIQISIYNFSFYLG